MKAISVLEPWAALLLGPKDIENRTWKLPEQYIGVPLALHASKRNCREEWSAAHSVLYGQGMRFPERTYPLGAIIGVITFTACVEASDSPWFAGPYGWVKGEVRPLKAIPCNGSLGFWTVPAEVEAEIRRQLEVKP